MLLQKKVGWSWLHVEAFGIIFYKCKRQTIFGKHIRIKFYQWRLRGCSKIMSAKNGWVQTPPPFFVIHCQHFPNPPSPLCQPLSAFPQPPLPPLSAVSICRTPPSFFVSVLWTYLMPSSFWITYFFWKKVHHLTKNINMSWWDGYKSIFPSNF